MSEKAGGTLQRRQVRQSKANELALFTSRSAFARAQLARRADTLLASALALASLALYIRTLAPDVVAADGGEFQFAAWNFAFVHPTGYPLYLILGGLFQHLLPLGNPAYRLNLFTAITAALAVAAVYRVVVEWTGVRAAAVLAAASFAVTRTFWYDANAAETYPLNAFFTAVLILLALRWQSTLDGKTLAALCLTCGLALAHHRTIVLWFPALALFFIIVARQRHLRFQIGARTLALALCVVLPLLLYLYIPLRAPASPYTVLALAPGREITLYDDSPAGFLEYFSGRVFQYELRWDSVSLDRLAALPSLLLPEFGAVGILLGLVGVWAMVRRKETARLALVLGGLLATVLFASLYHIGDIFHYYIPAYLVWSIWIGVGLAEFFPRLRGARFQIVLGLVLAILLPVGQIWSNFSAADRSAETQERERWSRILAAAPPDAILLSNDRDEMMPLWYIQYVEKVRPDLLGLFPLLTPSPQYANIVRLTDSVLDANRPILLIKPMPGLDIKYDLVAAAPPLLRVEGSTRTVPAFASSGSLAGQVSILGYDALQEQGVLTVTVYWQPQVKVEHEYSTFLHLLNPQGQKVGQGGDHRVGGDFYPAPLWQVGEILRDRQRIPISSLPPGPYRLRAGMYSQPELLLGDPIDLGVVEIR